MNEALRSRLLRIYADAHVIAVVGASPTPGKASQRIPAYLQSQGYTIRPVNPRGGAIFGVPAVATLSEIAGPVDVVQVFRPAAEAPAIAREAVAIGARVLWLQEGIVSGEAREIAEAAGLEVVMDRCMGATHAELGLGPGPD